MNTRVTTQKQAILESSVGSFKRLVQAIIVSVLLWASVVQAGAWGNIQNLIDHLRANVARVTQYGQDNMATLYQRRDDPFLEIGNWTHVGQVGEGNLAFTWQTGLDNVVRITQVGTGNIAFSAQSGRDHFAAIGQFGDQNTAFAWQEGNDTEVVIIQFGGENAIRLWHGVGLRLSVTQFGK